MICTNNFHQSTFIFFMLINVNKKCQTKIQMYMVKNERVISFSPPSSGGEQNIPAIIDRLRS